MKINNILFTFFSSLTFFTLQNSVHSNEIYNCDSSVLKVYSKDFECNDTSNYFLNSYYSDHQDRLRMEQDDSRVFDIVKKSSLDPLIEALGLYSKNISGENQLVFGFPDQRMKRDSNSLWEAFNYEFDRTTSKPKKTEDLNNGFNSSLIKSF